LRKPEELGENLVLRSLQPGRETSYIVRFFTWVEQGDAINWPLDNPLYGERVWARMNLAMFIIDVAVEKRRSARY